MRRSQGRDLLTQLEPFVERGLIEDVAGMIKTGKEASVYCCRAGAAALDLLRDDPRSYSATSSVGSQVFVAAKVYRGQQYRFKNDAVYQEARARELGLRGSALRAFEKRRHSATGRAVQSGTWQHREYECLETLYEAGADVPRPLAAAESAILLEYFGDEEDAAQQLNRVRLGGEEAEALFLRVINNVELMLAMNLVHGDLSPHNILYWQGEIRIIDFPQTTDPRFNSHCYDLLSRDVQNICRYFDSQGVETDAGSLTADLWRRFQYAEL